MDFHLCHHDSYFAIMCYSSHWTKNPIILCSIISCYFFFIWLKILLLRVNLRWLGFTDVMMYFFVAWLLTDYYISRFVMSSFAVSFVVMSTICPDNVESYITSTNLSCIKDFIFFKAVTWITIWVKQLALLNHLMRK